MATSPTQAQESKTAEVRFQFHHGSIAADIKQDQSPIQVSEEPIIPILFHT